MKKFVSLLVGALLLISVSSYATTLSVLPASQNVTLGDSFDVALAISGLGGGSAPSLGAFDVNVTFDAAIIGFAGATFGDPVLGNQLDLLGFGFNPATSTPSPGGVNVFDLSFDFPDDLDSLQAGSFTLATLSFSTLSIGTSTLGLSVNALGDAWGDPISPNRINNGLVSVAPVPEPATMLLFGTGLAGLASARMRKKKKA